MLNNEECEECGFEGLEFIGDVKNTRTFKCPECFTEKLVFIKNSVCEHEYDRNLDKCIHCGLNK